MVVHFGYFQIHQSKNKREEIIIVIYLSSNKNNALFDFLIDDKKMMVKKIIGRFSIEKFAKFDIRSLSYYKYLIIDILAIEEEINIIIKNLIAIKSLYDMKIILLANEIDREDLKLLIDKTSIYNIVTSTDPGKIKEEMLISISAQGMDKEYLELKFDFDYGNSISEDISKDDDNINGTYYTPEDGMKIILLGSMERVGTTTTALNITSYLASKGSRVSYTEANPNKHLQEVHKFYFKDKEIKDENNYFTVDNINYFFNYNIPSSDNLDFSIVDLGEINDLSIKIFDSLEGLKILCSGSRPWEIDSLNNSIEELREIADYSILIPKDSSINVQDYTLDDYDNYTIYPIKYSTNIFNTEINKKTWENLIRKYRVKEKARAKLV